MNVSKNVFHIMGIQSLIVKPQSYSRAIYVNRGRVIGARKCCGRISKWRPLSVSYIGHPLRLIQYFSCILPLTKDESWALRCPVDIHNQSPEDLKEGFVASFLEWHSKWYISRCMLSDTYRRLIFKMSPLHLACRSDLMRPATWYARPYKVSFKSSQAEKQRRWFLSHTTHSVGIQPMP